MDGTLSLIVGNWLLCNAVKGTLLQSLSLKLHSQFAVAACLPMHAVYHITGVEVCTLALKNIVYLIYLRVMTLKEFSFLWQC